MGVGMPVGLLLEEFGAHVWSVFGGPPYLVGSALKLKSGWRDVDVRMILDDDEWDKMGLGEPRECQRNAKWVALTLAFSALGKQMTGLPIDFQLQRQTEANAEFSSKDGHSRSALGMTPSRYRAYNGLDRDWEDPENPTPDAPPVGE